MRSATSRTDAHTGDILFEIVGRALSARGEIRVRAGHEQLGAHHCVAWWSLVCLSGVGRIRAHPESVHCTIRLGGYPGPSNTVKPRVSHG